MANDICIGSRFPLCAAAVAKEPGIHHRRRYYFGPRDWCEYGNLQRPGGCGTRATALSRTGSSGYGLGKQSALSTCLGFIPKLSRLAAKRSIVSTDGGVQGATS